jgi:hypothetical protein
MFVGGSSMQIRVPAAPNEWYSVRNQTARPAPRAVESDDDDRMKTGTNPQVIVGAADRMSFRERLSESPVDQLVPESQKDVCVFRITVRTLGDGEFVGQGERTTDVQRRTQSETIGDMSRI